MSTRRIIALVDNDQLGLQQEVEVLGITDKVADSLEKLKLVKYYDDTKPMVGKSVNVYEEKSYPPDRQVFHNDGAYISNCTTSGTWVTSEWDCLIHGTQTI